MVFNIVNIESCLSHESAPAQICSTFGHFVTLNPKSRGQGQWAVHSLIPPFPFLSFLVVHAISFQKQPISYSLLINPSSLFSIRVETGEISLTRTLDYESDQRRYLLMVRASEESGGLSAAAEVRLMSVSNKQ